MDIRHAVGVKVGVPAEKLADVLTYRQSPHFTEGERALFFLYENDGQWAVNDMALGRCRRRSTRSPMSWRLRRPTFKG